MIYRVVAFSSAIGTTDTSATAAGQLESLINSQAEEGWEYIRLEHVDTYVAGSSGCFGLGATPAQVKSVTMAVFRK
jgi:hypothetical protein